MGAHGRQRGIEMTRAQGRDFIERAFLHHPLEARIDARIKRLALGREEDSPALRGFDERRAARSLERRKRFARRLKDFKRAQNALRVGVAQPGGGLGIARGEFGVQRLRGLSMRSRAHRAAHVLRHLRNVGEAKKRGLEIHAGAAGNDRRQPGRRKVAQCRGKVVEPTTDGIIHRGVDMAEEMMGNDSLFLSRRPRGYNAQVSVNLHRIRVDDRAADPPRDLERQRRLARSGRTCNENGARRLGAIEHGAIAAQMDEMSKAIQFVATFVAGPGAALSEAAMTRASREAGIDAIRVDWLENERAADAFFEYEDANAISARLHAALADEAIDVIVQPVAARRKTLLVADMDSTMIEQECLDELADMVGLRAHIAAITERAMAGELEFEEALIERVRMLRGVTLAQIETLLERITLTPGARALVSTMRAHGAQTVLVSGGFAQFTEPVAARIGFHETRANRLEIENGALTGVVFPPVQGRAGKRAALVELREARGLAREETLAIGDGANDVDMLREAGLGVAYHAKPKVAAAASARIDHADLSALLHAQGYRREEFVGWSTL